MQSTPILSTKLHVPAPRPDLVARARLQARLDKGMETGVRLILVSAPAGFGKTSLLADWLTGQQAQVAWLSLDEDDNDLHRFLAYLLATLAPIGPTVGADARELLQSPQRPSPDVVLTLLINDLTAAFRDAGAGVSCIIVLDDYHLIEATAIHEAVAFLLSHMPPQMRLVIATRADPPLPLPRLRIRRQLVEIRASDLRFTHEETALFLNEVMGLNLDQADIATLESRTEGWIASLQLVALALQGTNAGRESGAARIASFIAAFGGSHRHVIDYLAEEVLSQQPADIRSFLLQTSILERLTAPLCDAILCRGVRVWESEGVGEYESVGVSPTSLSPYSPTPTHISAQVMLESLDRANLFIMPLDHEQRWYRYHRLFADFLRNALAREDPGQVPALHCRAAVWYESQAMLPDAIAHALKGEDFDHAARLIRKQAQETLMHGGTTLVHWLRALPTALVANDLLLNLYYAEALVVAGEVEAVEPHLHVIETRLLDAPVSPDERRDTLSQVLAIRAYLDLCRGNLDHAVDFAQRAMADLPPDSAFLRSITGWILGLSLFFDRDTAVAQQVFGETLELSRTTGNVLISALSIYVSGYLYSVQGQLRRAKAYFERGLHVLDATSGAGQDATVSPNLGLIYQALGEVLREMNDLDTARDLLAQAVVCIEAWGNAEILVDTYAVQARVLQAAGDEAGAREAMAKAMALVSEAELSPLTVRQIEAHWARLCLFQGDVGAAVEWAGRNAEAFAASATQTGNIMLFVRWMEISTLARLHLARGDDAAALDVLTPLRESMEAVGWDGIAIELRTLEAVALYNQGSVAEAVAMLARAFSLAEPEGYIRTFVDVGQAIIPLLRIALEQSIAPDYVRGLLAISDFGKTSPESEASATIQNPESEIIEPLSVRELDVMRLIAKGCTNREIAERLYVAVSTVKTHINNIYGKLGVNNRVQAVTRATELGLIEPL